MKNSNSWYNKTILVVLSLIFFFPVGLYALWKNEKATKALKIIVTIFFSLFIIVSINIDPIPEKFNLKEEKQNKLREIAYTSEQNLVNNLKDPSSYELILKDYNFLSDTIYEINITYSATNSFGGRIQEKYLKMGVLKFNPKDSTFINIVKFEK